jgi:cytochrome P450
MAELMNHPHEMRKLQAEVRAAAAGTEDGGLVTEDHLDGVPYLKAVIGETMRLHAPAALLIPRETTEDTELLGYHIPARTRVVINAWAIGRDPATWERAEEFVPQRFVVDDDDDAAVDYSKVGQDFRSVPFGAGRRGCPGAGFAAPTMELALANMLYHFDWELTGTDGGGRTPPLVDVSEAFGLSVRLKAPLILVAKPWSSGY